MQTFAHVGNGHDASSFLDREPPPPAAELPPKPLRLGVIGLGAVAQAVHLPLLARHPTLFAPTAVCEVSPSTRAVVADRLDVPARRRFADAGELLALDDLDAVAILTSGSHGALAIAAAEAGLAVFCEKPLAYTLAEADALAELEPRLMLGYMKLYDPAVERACAILAERPRPRSVEVVVLHPPPGPQLAHAALLPPPADIDPGVREQLREAEVAVVERALGQVSGDLGAFYADVLLGSVVHDLAVIRALAGGPLEVARADAWPDGSASSVAVEGQLSGGTRVSIRWHYLESYPAYREEVRVHDDIGSVELRFPSPYLLHAPTVLEVSGLAGDAARTETYRSTAEAFERQWLAFAAFAGGGAAPRATVAEGRVDIVACQAAVAALAAGRGVAIGGETREAARGGGRVDGNGQAIATGPKEEAS